MSQVTHLPFRPAKDLHPTDKRSGKTSKKSGRVHTLPVNVIGIELRDGQAAKFGAGGEYSQAGHRILKGHPLAELRHIGDGQLAEVDHIHVKMNHKPSGVRLQILDCLHGGLARITLHNGQRVF